MAEFDNKAVSDFGYEMEFDPKIGLYFNMNPRTNTYIYAATDKLSKKTHTIHFLDHLPTEQEEDQQRAYFNKNFRGVKRHLLVAKWAREGKLGSLDGREMSRALMGFLPQGHIFSMIVPIKVGGKCFKSDESNNQNGGKNILVGKCLCDNLVLTTPGYEDLMKKNFWNLVSSAGRDWLRKTGMVGEKDHNFGVLMPYLSSKIIKAEDVLNVIVHGNKELIAQVEKDIEDNQKKGPVRVVSCNHRGENGQRLSTHHIKKGRRGNGRV